MNGDVEAEIDAAIAREMPGASKLLDEMDARLVPEGKAKDLGLLAPDESYDPDVPDPNEIRAKLLIALKELGKLQTGRPVPLKWCHDAATEIAEYQTGECDFDLEENDNIGAIQIILDATLVLVAAEMRKASPPDPDIPF